jgi:hypothetical protein
MTDAALIEPSPEDEEGRISDDEEDRIPDNEEGRITDRASFDRITGVDQITGADRRVAGLYAYAKLDRLVDLACKVAADFFARPHLYTDLADPEMPTRLAQLHSRIGSDEFYPSPAQRCAMYDPVFGACNSDGADTSDFARLRDGLLAAASTFAEWSQATGIPMLRERVRTEHRPFRDYLDGVAGATVAWSRGEVLPRIANDEAYQVLRDSSVIAVFGLTRTPNEDWPYRGDANGDKVVEEISKALESPEKRLTREGFSALQRVALRGAEGLAAVMNFSEGSGDEVHLRELITRCYTWHAALKAWHSPGAVIGSRNGSS